MTVGNHPHPNGKAGVAGRPARTSVALQHCCMCSLAHFLCRLSCTRDGSWSCNHCNQILLQRQQVSVHRGRPAVPVCVASASVERCAYHADLSLVKGGGGNCATLLLPSTLTHSKPCQEKDTTDEWWTHEGMCLEPGCPRSSPASPQLLRALGPQNWVRTPKPQNSTRRILGCTPQAAVPQIFFHVWRPGHSNSKVHGFCPEETIASFRVQRYGTLSMLCLVGFPAAATAGRLD